MRIIVVKISRPIYHAILIAFCVLLFYLSAFLQIKRGPYIFTEVIAKIKAVIRFYGT